MNWLQTKIYQAAKVTMFTLVLALIAFALQLAKFDITDAATGINQQLNYQGKLMTTAGVQVSDASYNFRFRIYDAASGGTVLWTERWTSTTTQITTVNGVFSAALGSLGQADALSNINWNSDSLYLQVDLDADGNGSWEESFATRKRLTSTPYAFNANQVNGFSATSTAAVANYIPVFDSNLTLNLFNGGVSSTRATTSAFVYIAPNQDASVDHLDRANGDLYVGGDAEFDGSVYFGGLVAASASPTLPHTFSTWTTGAANSNVDNASLYINPASAVSDSNLLGVAVGGSVKFLVDAEGDVFANNLTLSGTQSVGLSTISTLTVENNSYLGDASNADWTHIKGSAWIDSNKNGGTSSSTALVISQQGTANYLEVVDNSSYYGGTRYFTIGNDGTASTTKLYVQGNATTSQNLTVGGYASTTNLVLSNDGTNLGTYNDVYVSGGNLFFNATQITGGGGIQGSSGAWQSIFNGTALTPTSTAGFFVNASSTVAANFRVDGNSTTTGQVSGNFNSRFGTDSIYAQFVDYSLGGLGSIATIRGNNNNGDPIGTALGVDDTLGIFENSSGSRAPSIIFLSKNYDTGSTNGVYYNTTTSAIYINGGAFGVNTSTPYANMEFSVSGTSFFDNKINIQGNSTSQLLSMISTTSEHIFDIDHEGKFQIGAFTAGAAMFNLTPNATQNSLGVDLFNIQSFGGSPLLYVAKAGNTNISDLRLANGLNASSTANFLNLKTYGLGNFTDLRSANLNASGTATFANVLDYGTLTATAGLSTLSDLRAAMLNSTTTNVGTLKVYTGSNFTGAATFNTGGTLTGLFTASDLRPSMLNASTTNIDTLKVYTGSNFTGAATFNSGGTLTGLFTASDFRPSMLNASTTNVGNLTVYTGSTFNGLTTFTDLRATMLNASTTNVGTLKVYTGSNFTGAATFNSGGTLTGLFTASDFRPSTLNASNTSTFANIKNYGTYSGDGRLTLTAAQDTGGNILFSAPNPYITASSYITVPGGLYVSGGTAYFANSLKARGGIANDTAAYLTIDGGTGGSTYFSGNVGVGTTTPPWELTTEGSTATANATEVGSNYTFFKRTSNDTAGGVYYTYGNKTDVYSTGTINTTGTLWRLSYGMKININDTGATTNGGTFGTAKNTYGVYAAAATSGASSGAATNTRNNFGIYGTATGDTNGTTNNYGLYGVVTSGDFNYGAYLDVTAAAGQTGYGLYAIDNSAAGTSYAGYFQGSSASDYVVYINNPSSNPGIQDDSGAYLSASGVWTGAASWSWYKNQTADQPTDYLEKLRSLPIHAWQYKNEVVDGTNRYLGDSYVHVSPFLDDFNSTYSIGPGNGVNYQDWIGVTMAAVQELDSNVLKVQDSLKSLEDKIGTDQAVENPAVSNVTVGVIDNPDVEINSLVVNQAATFNGTLYVMGEAGFMHKVTFADDVIVGGKIYASEDQAGTAVVEANATSTEVVFNSEYETVPKIVASVIGEDDDIWVNWKIINKTTTGFRILLQQAMPTPISFDWIALPVKGGTKAPVIDDLVASLTSVGANIPVELWAKTTDPDTSNSDLSYSWKLTPSIGNIDGESGLVYWTIPEDQMPTTDTDVMITVTVSDGSHSATKSVTVKVLVPDQTDQSSETNSTSNTDSPTSSPALPPAEDTAASSSAPLDEVTGCTDPTANNYNQAATTDDGSCQFPQPTPTADAADNQTSSNQDNNTSTSETTAAN